MVGLFLSGSNLEVSLPLPYIADASCCWLFIVYNAYSGPVMYGGLAETHFHKGTKYYCTRVGTNTKSFYLYFKQATFFRCKPDSNNLF